MIDERRRRTTGSLSHPHHGRHAGDQVELIHNPKVGSFGGGSEAANALAAPAIAAAFHDATCKVIRRLPMKPAYVLAVLKI